MKKGKNQLISHNEINGNERGIWLRNDCNSNLIENNIIMSNTMVGIYLWSEYIVSNDNIIQFNDIIYNNLQVEDNDGINRWNSTSGNGNYWSDYAQRYPDATVNDTVWNTPYYINQHSKDYYPLVYPVNIPAPIAKIEEGTVINQHDSIVFNSSGCLNKEYIEKYSWNFLYDTEIRYLDGPSPTFTFDKSGTYNITLMVTDIFGRIDTDTSKLIVLDITRPNANAGSDLIIDQHSAVHLSASASSDNIAIVNHTWSIPYGNTIIKLYQKTASYTFHDAGEYAITLNVTDAEGNWDTDTLTVTVLDVTPPTADAGPDIKINQSDTVEFFFHQQSTDNVGIENWAWTFEYNGTEHTLLHSIIMSSLPLFKFDIPGIYIVTMNVTDEAGNWATDTLNITVLDTIAPNADAGNGQEIDAGTIYRFNGTGSGDNVGIVNYTWIFEYDGKMVILHGPSPDFSFDMPGKYLVKLVVTDSNGNSGEDEIVVIVKSYDPVIEDDGPADDDGEEREKGGGIPAWAWLVGAILFVGIIVVIVVFLRKKKGVDEENIGEDEMGRIGEDDGIGDGG